MPSKLRAGRPERNPGDPHSFGAASPRATAAESMWISGFPLALPPSNVGAVDERKGVTHARFASLLAAFDAHSIAVKLLCVLNAANALTQRPSPLANRLANDIQNT